jgi:glycosyltransferase involved in cell wall biosynthesis/ribosomal protein S18 acetylase RimI-like enzyme
MSEMNNIRLLHIVGDSSFGGAAKIILRLAEKMRSEGWQVDLLTTNTVFQQAAEERGIGTVDLDVIRREIRPMWDLLGLLRLYRFLRRERYTVVHTHTSKAGFVGRLAAWLARVPVILHTTHGFAFHERSSRAKRVFYSTLERLAAHWCDRVVSVSEFHRRWALELGICGENKIMAIPNGIALPEPQSRIPASELRRGWGADRDDLVILSTGRLAPEKGLEDLLKAASLLRRMGQRFRVVLAGDGPLRAQLEHLAQDLAISDQVTFLGYREDVPDLLAACDLVVLPSLREGLSIALLEAMAAGKPVVATSIGSNVTVASQAEMALLVPPCDPQALSEAILRCGRDPALRARFGNNARCVFKSRYTEERMLNAYRKAYFGLLRVKCPLLMKDSVIPKIRVIQRVRRAERADLPGIVAIHQEAFSHFFLTQLGRVFLHRYYELVLRYRAGILLVTEGSDGLEGFACGFADPEEFYALMRRRRWSFALPVLSALVRRPSLAAQIVRGMQRVELQASKRTAQSCELSSIAVSPKAGGRGVGKTLVKAFLDAAWSWGAHHVTLDTDADDNETANALYQRAGFQFCRRYEKCQGRWMNEYIIHREIDELGDTLHEQTANRY